MWDEITYPFPNFKGGTVEVWEWISNFIPHFTMHVITYQYSILGLKLNNVSKMGPKPLCDNHLARLSLCSYALWTGFCYRWERKKSFLEGVNGKYPGFLQDFCSKFLVTMVEFPTRRLDSGVTMNLIFLCFDICNYICHDTSYHFSVLPS